jgi:hypothetical protein
MVLPCSGDAGGALLGHTQLHTYTHTHTHTTVVFESNGFGVTVFSGRGGCAPRTGPVSLRMPPLSRLEVEKADPADEPKLKLVWLFLPLLLW